MKKTRLRAYLREDLLNEAAALNIDLSEAVEQGLETAIDQARTAKAVRSNTA